MHSDSISHSERHYSPLYFLAALGSGGLVVTFFMWLFFWVPHPNQPVPVYEDIMAAFNSGGGLMKAAIIGAWIGIAAFAALMVRLLVLNFGSLARWTAAGHADVLRSGNAEAQFLAAPLALAMAVNVGFVIGLVYVPGLWTIVEYMFPAAIAVFLLIGVWALRMLGHFWGRVLTVGGFDCSKNNSFAQLLPAFALSMIGVGLAAPAAMSAEPATAGVSYILSTFFIVAAVVLGAVKLFLGVRSMMEHGASDEGAPTLWIVVPMLSVIGIALMRQSHGLHVHFDAHGQAASTFSMLTTFVSLQVGFILFGWIVLRRVRYFRRFVFGGEYSAGAYALICPGVALSVLIHFYTNNGLVAVGLIEKFGVAYWVLTGVAILLQIAMIALILKLNAKYFGSRRSSSADPQTVG